MRVLMIEDAEDLAEGVVAHLARSGVVCDLATTVESAHDFRAVQSYDAMLLDINLPDGSGLNFLGRIRAAGDRTPVLMLTALTSVEDRVAALDKGADDYLGKPFDPDELNLRLDRLLGRRPTAADETPSDGQKEEAAKAPTVGDTLGRYQVLEIIGEGSMGTVFRGWDPRLRRTVALKTVRLDVTRTTLSRSELISRLLHEAVMGARFSHPNIVAVFDVGDAPNAAFMALEYVEGWSLDAYLREFQRLPSQSVAHVGAQVAAALAAAHACSVVHHDVKPGNVMLGPNGLVKVTDFGLANWVSELVRETGRVFGTPGFLAPEALRGQGYDEASDLFGLGAILYRALTGVPAFPGKTISEMVATTLGGEVVLPSEYATDVDPELEMMIMALLQRNRELRPPSADQVRREMRSLITTEPPDWTSGMKGVSWSNEEEGEEISLSHSTLIRTG